MSLTLDLLQRFEALLAEAKASGEPEPTAMTLATSDSSGRVSARTVLLKDVGLKGFSFYTNLESNKGRQLAEHPQAALLFLWKTVRKQVQVKIEGRVEAVSEAEADAYFASRPRDSQLGAWASQQSRELASRDELLAALEHYRGKFEGVQVPRPAYWSGFTLVPDMIEFWYGAPFRLHDRHRFTWSAEGWRGNLLSP
jgi:pyridoxamine 5'-phosphate oxidase